MMTVTAAAAVPILLLMAGGAGAGARPPPRRILVDTDDIFAILYLLKQDRSEFDLKVRTRVLASSFPPLEKNTAEDRSGAVA